MRKTKIFLDTSVISYLFKSDLPEREAETRALWEYLIAGKYDIVLSDDVLNEVSACNEPKRQMMRDMLAKIEFKEVKVDLTVKEIADEIIQKGILNERNRIDCNHIACAIVSNCRYLLSWNFNDLANTDTNNGVRAITHLLHFSSIDIISPFNLKFREEK